MTNPQLITTPFAENGTKNTIPEGGAAEPQLATMQAGFPEITQRPINEGGVPPERADFNGILNLYGQHLVHLNKGLAYEFDQDFANSIGGYPLNARIMLTNGDVVQNTQEGNTNNPNSNMGGWKSSTVSKDVTVPTYKTTDDGVNPVTGVADGAYFNVRSEDDDTIAIEYQNVSGSAVATGKSYLSAMGVQLQEKSANTIKDASGKSQQDVNNSKSIEYLLTVTRYSGLMVKTTSYHSELNIGGNTYKYDTSISRLSHNGGTHIDPTKTFPVNWADKTQQQAWFTATSDLMGVFVLVKPDTDLCASDFGAHPEKDSSYAIQTAVNYSAYRTVIYADVVLNSSETLQIKNGCGLRGDHYTHNSRSTLKTSILNYSGTGDAVRFGDFSDMSARNTTLKDLHLFDVLGTARCATIAYDLLGSDVDFVTTGFEVSTVVQRWLYYINKFKVFGYNYRKNGILIGGNINEGAVEFKLISTSLEIDKGFACGLTSAAYGVLASSSNNPTISGSVEQHSGRHFDFNQIRGGAIKPYFESPAVDGSTYQNIQMIINRCYGSEFIVYGSGKSGYSGYIDNSRDCKISGEIKGGVTADLNITSTCFGINTSSLHACKIVAANYSTGSIVGRATNGGVVRDSYGAATATPTSGCYGTGSKLWYTNPTTLTPITVVTDVTLNTDVTPNTITKTTKTINQKEIGKLITVAGSFGTLAATTVTGIAGESVLTVNSGANNILVGDYLSIPTNSGSYRIDYIYQDGVNTMIRVNRALTVSVSAVTVSYFAPTVEPIIVTTQ